MTWEHLKCISTPHVSEESPRIRRMHDHFNFSKMHMEEKENITRLKQQQQQNNWRLHFTKCNIRSFWIRFPPVSRVSPLQKRSFRNHAVQSALPSSSAWSRNRAVILWVFSDIFFPPALFRGAKGTCAVAFDTDGCLRMKGVGEAPQPVISATPPQEQLVFAKSLHFQCS